MLIYYDESCETTKTKCHKCKKEFNAVIKIELIPKKEKSEI